MDECKKIYEKVNLGNQLSDSLIPSQICATAVDKDGKVLDACQGQIVKLYFQFIFNFFFELKVILVAQSKSEPESDRMISSTLSASHHLAQLVVQIFPVSTPELLNTSIG